MEVEMEIHLNQFRFWLYSKLVLGHLNSENSMRVVKMLIYRNSYWLESQISLIQTHFMTPGSRKSVLTWIDSSPNSLLCVIANLCVSLCVRMYMLVCLLYLLVCCCAWLTKWFIFYRLWLESKWLFKSLMVSCNSHPLWVTCKWFESRWQRLTAWLESHPCFTDDWKAILCAFVIWL